LDVANVKFRGNTAVNLDAKNRLAIPTKYRQGILEACAGEIILSPHPRGCLLLVPAPEWDAFEEDIMSRPSNTEQATIFKEWLVGGAEDLVMDGTGRVVVSSELRKLVGLEKELMLVGQRTHFNVWDREKYEARSAKILPKSGGEFVVPEGYTDITF
jgi:MraZ protein